MRRAGQPVPIQPKPFALLALLLRERARVVPADELLEALWPDTVVTPASLNREFFRESDHTTVCGWKGTASYYDLVVDGQINKDAAWCYPDPKPEAAAIKDFVAFWKGVQVVE